jgi:hypothetical protein
VVWEDIHVVLFGALGERSKDTSSSKPCTCIHCQNQIVQLRSIMSRLLCCVVARISGCAGGTSVRKSSKPRLRESGQVQSHHSDGELQKRVMHCS